MTAQPPKALETTSFDDLAEDDDKNHIFCGKCQPVANGQMVICFCGALTVVDDSLEASDIDCEDCVDEMWCPKCGPTIIFH